MELKQLSFLNLQTLPEPEGQVFACYTDEHFEDEFPWQRQEGLQIVILEAA